MTLLPCSFERERLGGRARELKYDGLTLELGASIVWDRNFLMRDLAQAAGLERQPVGDGGDAPGLLAVYDGQELVFTQSPWRLVTLLRALWRYWFSILSFWGAPGATFEKFQGIYKVLEAGQSFDRPADLLRAVGLYDLTQQSVFEWSREQLGTGGDLLVAEVLGGVNRCNYNQGNMQLNALAGMVSMLPATQPGAFRLKGGNGQLAPRLLSAVNATVYCPVTVSGIARLADGRFSLSLAAAPLGDAGVGAAESCGSAVQEGAAGLGQGGEAGRGADATMPFDAVIVATPLEFAHISFSGFEVPPIPARKFQQTISTFVKGAVRPSYFGLAEMTYAAILVSDEGAARIPWSSLGLVGRTASDNATLWKLFSREPIPHAWMSMLFERDFEVVATQVWQAYPAFDPPEDFAPFKLTEGLFYAAALENAASAMEVAAIEGRLTAQMAAQHVTAAVAAAGRQRQQGSAGVLEGVGLGADGAQGERGEVAAAA